MTVTHSYDVVETALQTILQGVSGLSTSVKLSDYSLLDNGTAQFIVLQPDSFDSDQNDAWGRDVKHWNILAEVFQKYTKETETMTNFRSLRTAIINELEKYPTLNNAAGVLGRTFSGEGGVINVTDKNNPTLIYYKMQTFRVVVTQEVTDITGGEFA
jgi:hypothetical protein